VVRTIYDTLAEPNLAGVGTRGRYARASAMNPAGYDIFSGRATSGSAICGIRARCSAGILICSVVTDAGYPCALVTVDN
jgi:hypothetical protein